MIWDKNDVAIFDGCIIDLHQTVNGCNLFYIKTALPLDIRYEHDHERKYEYDKEDLLKPCRYSGEVDFEITNPPAPPQACT